MGIEVYDIDINSAKDMILTFVLNGYKAYAERIPNMSNFGEEKNPKRCNIYVEKINPNTEEYRINN